VRHPLRWADEQVFTGFYVLGIDQIERLEQFG
jgi:hypothetical protein